MLLPRIRWAASNSARVRIDLREVDRFSFPPACNFGSTPPFIVRQPGHQSAPTRTRIGWPFAFGLLVRLVVGLRSSREKNGLHHEAKGQSGHWLHSSEERIWEMREYRKD